MNSSLFFPGSSSPGKFLIKISTCSCLKKLVCFCKRYVDQGKGILQPHNLIDELESIVGDDAIKKSLSDGPFGEFLKSAMVRTKNLHSFLRFLESIDHL